ncbi:ORF6N domain-containing protein [Bacteroides acidifaciens]|uniref:ORF6N domain-containing protein n=1 Tax=Bacteroides acidifaciens TaxID=85831 RepID=UPI001C3D4166|nr:ORF6N domain-containing protein [Bacteroides acidifaciens]
MDDIAIIENKIYEIRGQKVMLDFDLAEMYGVETKRLKEQVRRNIERFPAEFMFELTKEEVTISRSQIATLKTGQGYNIKYLPFAFTEYGIVMLSSVLKSKTAVEVNINIIRAFVRMRQYLLSNIPKKELEELKQRIEYLEEDITSDRESYEKQFDDLFNAFAKISAIIQSRQTPLDRVKIEGFKTNNKEKSNE